MSKIARLAVLVVGLMSLFAMLSASAGATTWSNDGDTHFLATGGAGTLSSTGVNLSCGNSDATGKTTNTSATPAPVADITITFTGCLLSGQSVGVECTVVLTATSQTTVAPRVTTGVGDTTCGVYLAGIKTCHISGTVNGTYTNATSPASPGRLTVTAGGNLRTSNGASNCALGANDAASLTELTFTVSGGTTGGPIITGV